MKRNLFIITISFLMIQVSCKEEWLTPNPLSFYAPENVYINEQGLRAILPTLRKDLKSEFYNDQNPIQSEFGASDLATSAQLQDFITLTPSSSRHVNWISNVYIYIKNANVLISRVDDVKWDNEETRNYLLAEGYFYRSYWYYRLVNSYGDVPWIGEELNGAKLDFYTYSRWAILKKLQKDMEFAAEWLPEKAAIGAPTKYAANMLLTKIYLANTEFDKAIASASVIINGPFALMKSRFGSYKNQPYRNVLWDLHRAENKNLPENTETIFTLIDRLEAPAEARAVGLYLARGYVCHWWSWPDSRGTAGVSSQSPQADTLGQGNADVAPNHFFSHTLYSEFGYNWQTTPDLRRANINWIEPSEIVYADPKSPDKGKPVETKYLANQEDTCWMRRSYPFYKTFMDPVKGGRPTGRAVGGNGDYYVYRLAETFLLRAEAYYWKNQLAQAAADINMVRERANAVPITAGDVTIDYIFHERARELYTEEPRHSEMVRVANIMAKLNLNGYSLSNFSEKNWYYDRVMKYNNWYRTPGFSIRGGPKARIFPYNVYWPIRQTIITANTLGKINQNIGYQGAENNIPPIETIE